LTSGDVQLYRQPSSEGRDNRAANRQPHFQSAGLRRVERSKMRPILAGSKPDPKSATPTSTPFGPARAVVMNIFRTRSATATALMAWTALTTRFKSSHMA
jgi:hypothetical protein